MAACKECVHYKLCDYKAWQKAIFSRDISDCMYIALNVVCEFFKSKEDVQEVKHGEWVEIDNKVIEHGLVERKGKTWKCTNCGEARKTRTNPDMNYCPNCGAKMKEGV